MSDNLQELEAVAALSTSISLNGEMCELVPLSPGDLAKATKNLRKLRMDRYVEFTRGVPWGDGVRAKSMSEIMAQSITIFDVIDDREGAMFLIHQSLNKAGKELNLKQVTDMLDPIDNDVWLPMLLEISKIAVPGTDKDGDSPLPNTTSTL